MADGRVVVPGVLQTYWNADGVSFDGREFYGIGIAVICMKDGGRSLDANNPAGTAVTSLSTGGDVGNAVVIQPDGKLIVAGPTVSGFGLARYNTNGSLDSTFGSGGIVNASFSGLSIGTLTGLALQSNGSIVVAGSGSNGAANQFLVARFGSAGVLDSSFGTGGDTLSTFAGYSSSSAAGLAIQPNGSIVVAGWVSNASSEAMAVARYTSAGVLDTSFGTNGEIVTGFAAYSYASVAAVALQSDGKIVVAGNASTGSSGGFALARYTTAGALDSSFGSSGEVVTNFAGASTASAGGVAIQPNGYIVAVGGANEPSGNSVALARYTPAGALDASFGNSGEVISTFPGYGIAAASGVALQSDGKIITAGYAGNVGTNTSFGVARYTTGGTLDSTFGSGGQTVTSFSGYPYAQALAVAIQPDSNIVAAGFAEEALGPTQFLAQFAWLVMTCHLRLPARRRA
jgi:uncharacterized delta-60 repeat protein